MVSHIHRRRIGAILLATWVADAQASEPDSRYCISTSAHLGPIHLQEPPLITRLSSSTPEQIGSLIELRRVLGAPGSEKQTSAGLDIEWDDGEMQLEIDIDCKAPFGGSRHNHTYVVRHYRISVLARGDQVHSCIVSTSTQFTAEPWPLPKYGASKFDKTFPCSRAALESGPR